MAKRHRYQRKDHLYKKAKAMGLRSRAAFKLIEIQEKYHLVQKGDCVADLGCAPGAWSEELLRWVGSEGMVFGIDLEFVPTPTESQGIGGWHFTQGDFTSPEIQSQWTSPLQGKTFNCIFSDMAPKLTGIADQDHQRSFQLLVQSWEFSKSFLRDGGSFVAKVFPGEELEPFRKSLRPYFRDVRLLHLKSTRSSSREVYLIGLDKTKNDADGLTS